MRKPANIVLTLVGTAIAGGTVVKALTRPHPSSAYGYSTSSWRSPEQAIPDREYDNDEYLEGAGYYHAPYHAWFPMRFDMHDPARGYFRGGLWLADRDASGVTRSRPAPDALAAARAAYLKLHPKPGSGSSYGSRSYHGSSSSYYGHGTTSYRSSGWDGSSAHSGSSSSKSSGSGSSAGISHGGFGSHSSSGSSSSS
jgi:hypothetical protein